MKKLLTFAFLTIISTCAAFAQNGNDEREILKIHKGLDEAFLKSDVAYFERYFAPDYVYTNNFGERFSRAENLDYYRSFKTKPPFKVLANKSDNVKIKVNGNAALLTADWTTTVQSLNDPNAEPHTDTGRFTVFYERRGRRWLVVAEHSSEKNHDPKLMEQQVLKAGREYNELMKRLKSGKSYAALEKSGDIAQLARLLADEYTYTSRDGEISTKAEDLAGYKTNRVKLESAEILEQNVRVISNYTAVETGKIRYVGANAGKPFDITKRYTTAWVWRDFRWQIAADHTSAVSQNQNSAVPEVLKLNREYSEMIRRGDQAAIERVLADDYIVTDESGNILTKAKDLATYKNRQFKIESAETLDQKARVIGGDTVVVNATIRFRGVKNEKPFDITERATTVWTFRAGRWQIISDHFSYVKK